MSRIKPPAKNRAKSPIAQPSRVKKSEVKMTDDRVGMAEPPLTPANKVPLGPVFERSHYFRNTKLTWYDVLVERFGPALADKMFSGYQRGDVQSVQSLLRLNLSEPQNVQRQDARKAHTSTMLAERINALHVKEKNSEWRRIAEERAHLRLKRRLEEHKRWHVYLGYIAEHGYWTVSANPQSDSIKSVGASTSSELDFRHH